MFFKLPFYNPQIKFKDFLNSFFLGNPKEKLENELKNYFNSENILLSKSARQGITFILESLNLAKEDEIIIPSFICQFVPEAVIRAGAKPVFCEVEKEGFNMDIKAVESLISPKTKAIILAYLFGIPCETDKFVKLAREHNLILIEDCAQAFGAKYQGRLLGTFADFSVFSFRISKNIGGLGGGFLYSRNKENLEKIKKIASEKTKKTFSFKKYFELFLISLFFNKHFYWLLENFVEKYAKIQGKKENDTEYSLSLSDPEAKIAFLKVKRYENFQKIRNENSLIYRETLGKFFPFPRIPIGAAPAHPYFPVIAHTEIFNILKNKDIPVRRLEFLGEKEEKYFLLPLNYSPEIIKSIAERIKKIIINREK